MEIEKFHKQYMETALWASTTEDGHSMDDIFDIDDIHEDTRAMMHQDCMEFYIGNRELIDNGQGASQAGHDFWLNRNGHGAGFWDGDWGDAGDKLDKASKDFGSFDLYVGDDFKVHGGGG
ncbi:hypothetical protein [Parendozoicomonas haliclonae]|nr:hypothetical protein [Parendozoicomonas haliclonae]